MLNQDVIHHQVYINRGDNDELVIDANQLVEYNS
jgi:hypothetical protein